MIRRLLRKTPGIRYATDTALTQLGRWQENGERRDETGRSRYAGRPVSETEGGPCPECRTNPPRVTSKSPLGGAAVNRTPWAVDCPHHGRIHLNNHEYNRQASATKLEWTCPLCGAKAALSREELRAYLIAKQNRDVRSTRAA